MPRKQHTYHYIYKTTCKVNGKYYVGMHSTSNLEDGYIGSGKRLWNSIRKHGKENHEIEILEWFPDRSSLKNREKELVNESLLQDPMCMNLKLGGEGGWSTLDKNTISKISSIGGSLNRWKNHRTKMQDPVYYERYCRSLSNAQSGGKNGFYGKTHTEETKNRIGEKNSVHQTGSSNSQFGKVWITNGKETKSVEKSLLDNFVELGWKRGRTLNKT